MNVIDEINERDGQYVVNKRDEINEIDEGYVNEMDEGDEKDVRGEIDVTQLHSDPGLRIPIREYDVNFLSDHNDEIKSVALKNAPKNLKLTSPDIRKDIVNAAASETIDVIINDIGEDGIFSILVDESL
ncbi:DUF4371 domain-containing protein [Abeliophyllum distichum]|uniref:DUF4371 domain-containing protein n=1 Tax=Abeliophyllum distichum TaxID=126358 RepID=A0ABD1Q6X4_9LAMI